MKFFLNIVSVLPVGLEPTCTNYFRYGLYFLVDLPVLRDLKVSS